MTATSSMKDQYDCISFMTSALVDDQSWIALVGSTSTSSSRVAHLICTDIMHSENSKRVSMAFMCRLIPGMSSSLFDCCCVWITNQLINGRSPDLYKILMLYLWICGRILWEPI